MDIKDGSTYYKYPLPNISLAQFLDLGRSGGLNSLTNVNNVNKGTSQCSHKFYMFRPLDLPGPSNLAKFM